MGSLATSLCNIYGQLAALLSHADGGLAALLSDADGGLAALFRDIFDSHFEPILSSAESWGLVQVAALE